MLTVQKMLTVYQGIFNSHIHCSNSCCKPDLECGNVRQTFGVVHLTQPSMIDVQTHTEARVQVLPIVRYTLATTPEAECNARCS